MLILYWFCIFIFYKCDYLMCWTDTEYSTFPNIHTVPINNTSCLILKFTLYITLLSRFWCSYKYKHEDKYKYCPFCASLDLMLWLMWFLWAVRWGLQTPDWDLGSLERYLELIITMFVKQIYFSESCFGAIFHPFIFFFNYMKVPEISSMSDFYLWSISQLFLELHPQHSK